MRDRIAHVEEASVLLTAGAHALHLLVREAHHVGKEARRDLQDGGAAEGASIPASDTAGLQKTHRRAAQLEERDVRIEDLRKERRGGGDARIRDLEAVAETREDALRPRVSDSSLFWRDRPQETRAEERHADLVGLLEELACIARCCLAEASYGMRKSERTDTVSRQKNRERVTIASVPHQSPRYSWSWPSRGR